MCIIEYCCAHTQTISADRMKELNKKNDTGGLFKDRVLAFSEKYVRLKTMQKRYWLLCCNHVFCLLGVRFLTKTSFMWI